MRRQLRSSGVVLIFAIAAAACGAGSDNLDAEQNRAEQQESFSLATGIEVYGGEAAAAQPIVVLLHGGSEAGVTQLEPLATELSQRELLVLVPPWQAITDLEAFREDPTGSLFAQTEDVVCALREARAGAAMIGGDPDRLVLVADSQAGAVGLRVALSPPGAWPTITCQGDFEHMPTAFVGLAGNYTGSQYRNLIQPLELWEDFDPLRFLGSNPDLRVVLLHSLGDATVPPQQSEKVEAVLRDAGYSTTLIETGNGHASVIRPDTPTGSLAVEMIASAASEAPVPAPIELVDVGFDGQECRAELGSPVETAEVFAAEFSNRSDAIAWLLVFRTRPGSTTLADFVTDGSQHFDSHPSFMEDVAFRAVEPGDTTRVNLALGGLSDWVVACAVPDETGFGLTMYPGLQFGDP